MVSKDLMSTSLERIREKITELEAKISDLRIVERELQALDRQPAPKARLAPKPPKPRQKRKPATAESQPEAEGQPEARQTIGAAIADVLGEHGPLSVAEIAEHVKAAGRDINNRTVSFSLQALKKRGLVKGADGKWALPKARAKRAAS